VLLQHSIMLRLLFIVECGIAHFLCAMRLFEVRASSSSPRLQEIAYCTQSLAQSLTPRFGAFYNISL